jgi:hypothetical protein
MHLALLPLSTVYTFVSGCHHTARHARGSKRCKLGTEHETPQGASQRLTAQTERITYCVATSGEAGIDGMTPDGGPMREASGAVPRWSWA